MKNRIFFTFIILTVTATAFCQNGYTVLKTQLPFSTEEKNYYVKQIGTNYILNGDIIVGSALQKSMIYQSNNTDGGYLWPKGGVPVKIDLSMYKNKNDRNMDMAGLALNAIDAINTNTNIRLVPYSGQKDYIRVIYHPATGFGGVSSVGRQGGEQIIYITRESNNKTIVHELLHSMGFWHEQSRHDRDQFISINWSNIDSTFMHNFQIEPGTPSGKYDYESVMHYSAMAFAKDPAIATIQCKSGGTISNCSFGSAYIFSAKDIEGINATYWYNASLSKVNYQDELLKTESFSQVNKVQQKKVSEAVNVTQQPISDGMYKIKINQTGKYLAIEGVSKENGARLVQWDYVEQDNHKFYVKDIGNGYYVISAVHSNRYLNAAGQSKNDGTPIIQWDYAEQDNVKWRIYHSNQLGKPGWVLENKNASPIRLSTSITANNNGEPFVLMLPKRSDANDYEAMQTFTFERIGNLRQGEVKQYENAPGMLKKVKAD